MIIIWYICFILNLSTMREQWRTLRSGPNGKARGCWLIDPEPRTKEDYMPLGFDWGLRYDHGRNKCVWIPQQERTDHRNEKRRSDERTTHRHESPKDQFGPTMGARWWYLWQQTLLWFCLSRIKASGRWHKRMVGATKKLKELLQTPVFPPSTLVAQVLRWYILE